MSPQRIQRRRVKGWRMPVGAVYVGRPSVFGSPFTAEQAIDAGYLRHDDPPENVRRFLTDCFREWLASGTDWWQGAQSDAARNAMLARLPELRGHDLVCWCPLGQACHADILLRLANEGVEG